MIRKLFALVIFVVLVAGVLWLNTYPGTLTVDWQGYEIQTSLTVSIILFLTVLFLLGLVSKTWRFLTTFPMRLSRRAKKRDREKGLVNLIQAVAANALEKNSKAKEKAYAVQRYLRSPLAQHILLQVAKRENNEERAKEAIEDMQRHEESHTLVLIDQVKLCLAHKQYAQAHTHLLELERTDPTAPFVLKKLLRTSIWLQQFDKAQETAQKMHKLGLLLKDQWTQLQAHLLYATAQSNTHALPEKLALLKKVHQLAPGFAPAALQMAQIYKVQNKERKARQLLETTWQAHPDPNLVPVYLSVRTEKESVEIERLAHLAPKHLESYLILAEDALKNQEWRKARANLTAIEDTYGADARAYRLRAELELQEHSDIQLYKQWTNQALALQEIPKWNCQRCCRPFTEWQLMCKKCGDIQGVRSP